MGNKAASRERKAKHTILNECDDDLDSMEFGDAGMSVHSEEEEAGLLARKGKWRVWSCCMKKTKTEEEEEMLEEEEGMVIVSSASDAD